MHRNFVRVFNLAVAETKIKIYLGPKDDLSALLRQSVEPHFRRTRREIGSCKIARADSDIKLENERHS